MNKFNKVLKDKFEGKVNINKISSELKINPKTFNSWLAGVTPKLTKENIGEIERIAEHIGISIHELISENNNIEREVISSLKFKDGENTYFIKIEKKN